MFSVASIRAKLKEATGIEITATGVGDEIKTESVLSVPSKMKKKPRGAHPNPMHEIFDVDENYVYVKFMQRFVQISSNATEIKCYVAELALGAKAMPSSATSLICSTSNVPLYHTDGKSLICNEPGSFRCLLEWTATK